MICRIISISLSSWKRGNIGTVLAILFKAACSPTYREESEWYFPAFKVVCMGDTNGVDIAQATERITWSFDQAAIQA